MSDDITIELDDGERDRADARAPSLRDLFRRRPRQRRTADVEPIGISRSGRLLVVGLGVLLVLAVAAGITSLASSPPQGLTRSIGVSELRRDEVTYVKSADAFVVALPGEGFLVLKARSTHLGQPLKFCQTSQWFEDPLHGSKFDRHGYYRAGPAPRGLDRLKSVEKDGKLFIDPRLVQQGPPRGESDGTQPAGRFCG